jgi:hypothetical protein
MQAVDCQTMLVGQNAKPMALNSGDLTPAHGQRSVRQVSPVGSYAAGNVIAPQWLVFSGFSGFSGLPRDGESLADGRARPEPSSTGALGGRNRPRVSRSSGGRVCDRELVAVPVASGDVLRKFVSGNGNAFQ